MDKSSPPPIALRGQRIQAALSLREPDRVPFMPTVQSGYATGYGHTVYDAMKDLPSILPPMEQYLADYSPDLFYLPGFFPIDVMEAARATNLRWPGDYWGLPRDAAYQYMEVEFLADGDWDEYMRDPTRFLLHKVLPRRYEAFEGLALLNVHGLCGSSPLSLLGAGLPPVAEALQNLIAAGRLTGKAIGEMTDIALRAVELGYPVWGNFVPMCPFDEFGDLIRGIPGTLKDLRRRPELLNEAVARWGEISIPAAVQQGKMMHSQYAMIPLHLGMDSMMSLKNYEAYYWPHLKKLLLALIEADITPIVLCEGGYDTRLEVLTDVPAGRVVYLFEEVDMARAKKILGKTACIAGNIDTRLLEIGTADQVVAATRKLIDDCAPGGGYIMSCSMALDTINHELMRAWHDTTVEYGTY